MSIQAINWVLEEAPDVPAHLVSTLLALANHADASGRNAYVGQERLSWYTRKNKRNARHDVDALVKLGLLREGNQAAARHLRADRRPTVYDLAMERKRQRVDLDGENGGSQTTSRGAQTTQPARGVADDLPSEATGGRTRPPGTPSRGVAHDRHGGSHTTPEPSTEPTSSSSRRTRPAVARIVLALGITEEEAEEVYNKVIRERKPTAPGRYIDRLIEEGDIDQFHKPVADRPAPYSGPRCDFVPDRDGVTCETCQLPQGHPKHRLAA